MTEDAHVLLTPPHVTGDVIIEAPGLLKSSHPDLLL
jgi:hypothetical protein